MTYSRRTGAARVDSNHKEIKDALVEAGLSVVDLSGVGGGVPDLLVASGFYMALLEIKKPLGPKTDPDTHDDARDLTEAQVKFLAKWRGPKVWLVRSVADALGVFGKVAPPGAGRTT